MADRERLEGWEAIAGHLHVNKRTAQLWRKHRSLPVESTPTGRVSADPLKLDKWQQNEPPPEEEKRPPAGWRWWWIAVAVVVAAGLALAMRTRSTRIASVQTGLDHVAALDEQGRQLWRKAFNPGFHPHLERLTRIVDLNQDGQEEVLVAYVPTDIASAGSHLICYSRDGAELWRFHAGASPRVDKGESPTFQIRNMHVVPCSRGQCVALVSAHYPFSASQIALLDSGGRLISEYWHSGHLDYSALTDLDNDGRPEIAAGGVNNGRGQATLVVLDLDRLDGAAFEQEEERQFRGLAQARERARIFFPRSRLNQRTQEYNWVKSISVTRGQIQVQVGEHDASNACSIWYRFDCGLQLKSVVLGDEFVVTRKRLTLTGMLKPGLDDEDESRFHSVAYLTDQPDPGRPSPATCNTTPGEN